MTFTYNLASTNEDLLNISKVRLEIGDTQQNAGVRPDGSNLQDEEILLWLDEEDNDIPSTVARACSALAKMWTTVANITVGPRREELGQVADGWAKRAQQSAPAGDGTNQAKIVSIVLKHNPYRVRTESETGQ